MLILQLGGFPAGHVAVNVIRARAVSHPPFIVLPFECLLDSTAALFFRLFAFFFSLLCCFPSTSLPATCVRKRGTHAHTPPTRETGTRCTSNMVHEKEGDTQSATMSTHVCTECTDACEVWDAVSTRKKRKEKCKRVQERMGRKAT